MIAPQAAFGISVLFSFIAWGNVVARYAWPALRRVPPATAMRFILSLHAFRFIGLSFIVPGVTSPGLALAFARTDAYGDFGAAILAIIALLALPRRIGVGLAWAFNLWGTADLLFAFYNGNRYGLEAGQLGATYFIITVMVPLLLITHVVMFTLLLRAGERIPRDDVSRVAYPT